MNGLLVKSTLWAFSFNHYNCSLCIRHFFVFGERVMQERLALCALWQCQTESGTAVLSQRPVINFPEFGLAAVIVGDLPPLLCMWSLLYLCAMCLQHSQHYELSNVPESA